MKEKSLQSLQKILKLENLIKKSKVEHFLML